MEVYVRVDEIIPGNNDREAFDETGLRELAASIAQYGLAQPITVRPNPAYDPAATGDAAGNCTVCGEAGRCRCAYKYEIVAGERRWRAHRLLGATFIRALVQEMDDEQASSIMLLENI